MSLELISFAVDSITPPNNPPPFPPLPPIICADRLIMYITNPVENTIESTVLVILYYIHMIYQVKTMAKPLLPINWFVSKTLKRR